MPVFLPVIGIALQCRSKVRFISGGGGGDQSRALKARAARGVRGHAPSEDFEIWGL